MSERNSEVHLKPSHIPSHELIIHEIAVLEVAYKFLVKLLLWIWKRLIV